MLTFRDTCGPEFATGQGSRYSAIRLFHKSMLGAAAEVADGRRQLAHTNWPRSSMPTAVAGLTTAGCDQVMDFALRGYARVADPSTRTGGGPPLTRANPSGDGRWRQRQLRAVKQLRAVNRLR